MRPITRVPYGFSGLRLVSGSVVVGVVIGVDDVVSVVMDDVSLW